MISKEYKLDGEKKLIAKIFNDSKGRENESIIFYINGFNSKITFWNNQAIERSKLLTKYTGHPVYLFDFNSVEDVKNEAEIHLLSYKDQLEVVLKAYESMVEIYKPKSVFIYTSSLGCVFVKKLPQKLISKIVFTSPVFSSFVKSKIFLNEKYSNEIINGYKRNTKFFKINNKIDSIIITGENEIKQYKKDQDKFKNLNKLEQIVIKNANHGFKYFDLNSIDLTKKNKVIENLLIKKAADFILNK